MLFSTFRTEELKNTIFVLKISKKNLVDIVKKLMLHLERAEGTGKSGFL